MDNFFNGLVKVIVAIIVVAIIAAIVSKRSTSVQVIQTGSTAFASLLKTILSPISSTSAVATSGSGAPYSFGV
jgi:archaellum component FlaG (FlaF/FlaG flagellin family)